MLKLYIVVNDTHFYELKELEPLVLEETELPVKLVAKNGFHLSKPLFIRKHKNDAVLVGIGCEADNGRLWGGVVLSVLLLAIYFATGFRLILIAANIPLLFLVYKIFLKPGEFITADIIKK